MKNKIAINTILFSILFLLCAVEIYYLTDVWKDWISYALFISNVFVLACSIVFLVKEKESLYKFCYSVYFIALLILTVLTVIKLCGFMEHFVKDGELSVEAIKDYIVSLGGLGKTAFFILQIAQVTLIPIPSNVVTMVGVGIFGIWPAFFLSCAGQIIGSVIAYALGKIFGVPLVKWVVGEESFAKYNDMLKGKDKLLLTVMFLFPFFPDDTLCLIAGISSMEWGYFVATMFICRPLTCFGNALIANGALNIPFYGWGLVVWGALIIIVAVLFVLIFKYGDNIQEKIVNVFNKKR